MTTFHYDLAVDAPTKADADVLVACITVTDELDADAGLWLEAADLSMPMPPDHVAPGCWTVFGFYDGLDPVADLAVPGRVDDNRLPAGGLELWSVVVDATTADGAKMLATQQTRIAAA